MTALYGDYVATFADVLKDLQATGRDGRPMTVDAGIAEVHRLMRGIAQSPNKIMMIGNGGSAGIAGHMAIDFAKNGGVRAITFNDASSLTCLGNDLGYDQVFAKQVEMQGLPGDILIAISSSGRSANILRAAEQAAAGKCAVVTLTGFTADNPLRAMGAVNFYAPSQVYGFVETAHQMVLHAILDSAMGWTRASANVQPQGRAG